MAAPAPAAEKLHALIGDGIAHLSPHLIERLESTLASQSAAANGSTLVRHLRQMQDGECADGSMWIERQLHAGRCADMASVSRGLRGLVAVLQLLHAAQLTREDSSPDQHLGDDLTDGLLHAARLLAETASNHLHGRP